jgi:hypothetical protein
MPWSSDHWTWNFRTMVRTRQRPSEQRYFREYVLVNLGHGRKNDTYGTWSSEREPTRDTYFIQILEENDEERLSVLWSRWDPTADLGLCTIWLCCRGSLSQQGNVHYKKRSFRIGLGTRLSWCAHILTSWSEYTVCRLQELPRIHTTGGMLRKWPNGSTSSYFRFRRLYWFKSKC